jgi:hypothetical protein
VHPGSSIKLFAVPPKGKSGAGHNGLTAFGGMFGNDALRARRAGIDPSTDKFSQLLLATGGRIAALARLPTPSNEIVVREMVVQELKITTAVSLRILQLFAYLSDRLALPCHFNRCEEPPGMTRNAAVSRTLMECIVRICVTAQTCARHTPGRRLVRLHIIAFRWTIARGMAVYAAWMGEYFTNLGKDCTGARIRIRNSLKRRGRPQLVGSLRPRQIDLRGKYTYRDVSGTK